MTAHISPQLAAEVPRLRVAVIHYWLVTMRGGERLLERILNLFPNADLYTHVYDPAAVSPLIRSRNIQTTFIQRLPFATRLYQKYLPLMPYALEELDLQAYDLVISSEAGPAKGVIPRPDATHVCYCHSPMRYIWDQYQIYRNASGGLTRAVMPILAHKLRLWDVASSARVDRYSANSEFVAARIRKYYRRNAQVIHPPVNIDLFAASAEQDNYYLWVGQLVPYKACDIAIQAFNALNLPLLVVGQGSEKQRLQRMAGPNITFVDSMTLSELRNAYARTRALVFTAKEDFGIVPVEAQACGRPVIAYGAGGALETVKHGLTGLLFAEQTAESLIEAVEHFQVWHRGFDSGEARRHAETFRMERFDARFLKFAMDAVRQQSESCGYDAENLLRPAERSEKMAVVSGQ